MTDHISDRLSGSTIAISGGGIGGAAAALALARRGADVTLYERANEFREVGAGLQIGPHGWRILESWGLLDEIVASGFIPDNMIFRDATDGTRLLTMEFDDDFQDHYGGRYLVIHRSDLLKILIDAARAAGATLHNGVVVTDAATTTDGIDIALTWRKGSGPESTHADVLLAFDGIHSVMRTTLSDDAPVASSYVAYRGTASLPDDAAMKDLRSVIGYIGPSCHFIQYPLRGGELLNQVAVFESQRYLEGLKTGDVPDDWGNPDELSHAYDHCTPFIRERLEDLWTDTWWQMSDREPLASWRVGRMILLGDAAHPPLQYLASGAVMAMEDAEAVALFAAEAAHDGVVDWDQVLDEVEAERRPRCTRIQTIGRFWGELWHLDGTARLVRNELFRQADRSGWYEYSDWLWGYNVADRVHIKDPSKGDVPAELADWSYSLAALNDR